MRRDRETESGRDDGVLGAASLVGLASVSELAHVEADVASSVAAQRTLAAVEVVFDGDALADRQQTACDVTRRCCRYESAGTGRHDGARALVSGYKRQLSYRL